MNIEYIFWNRVDELRKKREIKTLKELADAAGMKEKKIKDQRSNQSLPKALDLLALAKVLDVSMEYLLTGEAEKKEHYPPRVDQIAKKLCLVSEQDLTLIERNVQLLPINRNSQENVVS